MGIGKSGLGGRPSILSHMKTTGKSSGGSLKNNPDIKYGGPVIDKFKSPVNDEKNISGSKKVKTKHHDDMKDSAQLIAHVRNTT
jgi:hypothetical protein